MSNNYFVFFKTAFMQFRLYNCATKEFSTVDVLPRDVCKFEMLRFHDDAEATDKWLKKYSKQFQLWNDELDSDRYCGNINFSKSYCNFTATTRNFNKRSLKNYKHHQHISTTEWRWWERCYNGGLQYLSKPDITVKCYSNDFKNQFPRCMNSKTKIPTKQGKQKNLTSLPKAKDLRPGFYHVYIRSDNDDFRKIFSYSKHNVYIKESLAHAMEHAEQFDVTIELVFDDKPNAFIYKEEDMVTLESVCGEWYSFMLIQKSKYPKNKLLKHLFSTCWSSINAGNSFWITWDQIEERKLDVGYGDGFDYEIIDSRDTDVIHKVKLLDTKQPYKFNLRLKPWICALSRNLTAKMALQDIDSVIRIQTDSVSFSKKQEFSDSGFVVEAKTTGLIHFYNVNSYKNLTTNYESGFYSKYKDVDDEEA